MKKNKGNTFIKKNSYYYFIPTIVFPFGCLLLFNYFINSNPQNIHDFSYIVSHPLVLIVAGLTSSIGANLGLFILKINQTITVNDISEARLISLWIGTVFIVLSVINIVINGGQINP